MGELVSVVVAVHNAEKYIDKCVYSICKQTYTDLQILLIENASIDNSLQVCNKWMKKDSRIFVRHLEVRGVSRARNEGISLAKGRYIIFIDSDDWVEEQFVSDLVKNQQENEFICAGYYIDYEKKNKIEYRKKIMYSDKNKDVLNKKEIVSLYKAQMFNSVWNKIYETSVVKSNNICFCQNLSLGEDCLFNIDYIEKISGKTVVVNTPSYHYVRRENESLDNKYHEDFYAIQKLIFESFLSYLKRLKTEESQLKVIKYFYFNALIVAFDNLYKNRGNMDIKDYQRKMLELKNRDEIKKLISEMDGKLKYMSLVRWKLISNGLFPIEYYTRQFIKKILKIY